MMSDYEQSHISRGEVTSASVSRKSSLYKYRGLSMTSRPGTLSIQAPEASFQAAESGFWGWRRGP